MRLAVTIRVLVHDTAMSKSLLGLLGLKGVRFLDTAGPDPEPVVPGSTTWDLHPCRLVVVRIGPGGATYHAPLEHAFRSRQVWFDEWWTTPVYFEPQPVHPTAQQSPLSPWPHANPITLSRRDLVLAAANQDGGAHVDPDLNAIYAGLSRGNPMGWHFSDANVTVPLEGAERAAIRQVAYEVVSTVERVSR